MSFEYPLGLLGLIGVPIIILIYILKNRYSEQVISSTYIWRLSEKFYKNRRPISKITGLISLICQILAVVAISLCIAQPKITLKNKAREYCFILDGSASMNMNYNGSTRFDEAKKQISTIIDDSENGSTYSLVYASQETRLVYENVKDKESAIEKLESLECGNVYNTCEDSVYYVQQRFNKSSGLKSYLYTDKDYKVGNVELVKIYSDDLNYTISDLTYESDSAQVIVKSSIIANQDSTVNVLCYLKDDTVFKKQEVTLTKGVPTEVVFDQIDLNFSFVKVTIDANDNYLADNSRTVYNINKDQGKSILIVTDGTTTFIESIIKSVDSMIKVEVKKSSEYDSDQDNDYGLYIFDGLSPQKPLPENTSAWFINCGQEIPNIGFSPINKTPVSIDNGGYMNYTDEGSLVYRTITKDIISGGTNLTIKKYYEYNLQRDFVTILEYNGSPLLFTGTVANGIRSTVFSFDLHDSNLPLTLDFILLLRNLISYSFPSIIEEPIYECGSDVVVNVQSGTTSMKMISPSGVGKYLSLQDGMVEYTLNEIGDYKLEVKTTTGEKTINLYSYAPVKEALEVEEDLSLEVSGEASNSYIDGIYDDLLILFILLGIAIVVDWMVYCHEQYQLR